MRKRMLIGLSVLAACFFFCCCTNDGSGDPRAWLKSGFVNENEAVYYYERGEVLTGWQTIDGNTYFFDDDGKMHVGWLVWEDEAYYFSKAKHITGIMLASQNAVIQDVDGIYWYVEFDETGKVVEATVDKYRYRMNDEPVPDVSEPNFGNK